MSPEKIIEALIFISDAPVKPSTVAEIFNTPEFQEMELTEDRAKELLDSIVERYEGADTPWELRRIGGGYQFLTRKEFFPYLKTAVVHKNQKKLSRSALETLAIIAYRQPVTRTEVEFIRGVNCDYAIQKLLDKNLIEIAGRASAPGKPLIYRTSAYFFEYFSINDISDLPKLQEITIDEEEYQRQFASYVQENEEMKEIVDENRQIEMDREEDEDEEVFTEGDGFAAGSTDLSETDGEEEIVTEEVYSETIVESDDEDADSKTDEEE